MASAMLWTYLFLNKDAKSAVIFNGMESGVSISYGVERVGIKFGVLFYQPTATRGLQGNIVDQFYVYKFASTIPFMCLCVPIGCVCRVLLNANYLSLQGRSEGVYQYAISYE